MNILVCPDSFKGSLSSQEACHAIAEGIRQGMPLAQMVCRPLADGGEGTMEAVYAAQGGTRHALCVTGPNGKQTRASFLRLPDGRVLVEAAEAIGLTLLSREERRPWLTTSCGLGQLILASLVCRPSEVLIALGGSGTVDGGIGMLQAMGATAQDADGLPVPRGAHGLRQLHHFSLQQLKPLFRQRAFTVLADVDNPLLGPSGSVYTFAPQKGADADDLPLLEEAMRHFAEKVEKSCGASFRHLKGAAAAGGIGFSLAACGARLTSGAAWVIEACRLAEEVRKADLIVTGEGRLDEQSLHGKAPISLTRLAKSCQKPVIFIAGSIHLPKERLAAEGIQSAHSLLKRGMSTDFAVKNAKTLLTHKVATIFSSLRR